MVIRTIPAGEFKAKCLKLLDEVAASGDQIVVTKRGRVVAHVVPPPGFILPPEALLGTVEWDDEEDFIGPTGEPLPGEAREWPNDR